VELLYATKMARHLDTHQIFSNKIGSEQIATPKALRLIYKYSILLEKKYSEGIVLEIGSGIGTIAHLVVTGTQLNYIAYETNDFCLKQLQENVKSSRLTCINNFTALLSNLNLEKVRFLIIDDFIEEKTLGILLSRIQPKYIFIEGHRFQLRRELVNIITKRVGSLFLIRLFIFSYDSKKGGFLVKMLYPSSAFYKTLAKLVTFLSLLRFKFVNLYRVYRILRFFRIYSFNSVRRLSCFLSS